MKTKNEATKAATLDKPEALVAPKAALNVVAPETVKVLWDKAKAAKAAADLGLLPKEQAAALWKQAEEASKPTPEAIAAAEAAKQTATNSTNTTSNRNTFTRSSMAQHLHGRMKRSTRS